MAALADLLLCDRSNVTAIVDKLEERGWARRERGKPGDRRFTNVVLTPAGRALRARVMQAQHFWVSARFDGLSAEQLDALADILRTLRAGLRADPEIAAKAAVDAMTTPSASPALADGRLTPHS
jgi:DNA-binding MarR family transcriptional regulator